MYMYMYVNVYVYDSDKPEFSENRWLTLIIKILDNCLSLQINLNTYHQKIAIMIPRKSPMQNPPLTHQNWTSWLKNFWIWRDYCKGDGNTREKMEHVRQKLSTRSHSCGPNHKMFGNWTHFSINNWSYQSHHAARPLVQNQFVDQSGPPRRRNAGLSNSSVSGYMYRILQGYIGRDLGTKKNPGSNFPLMTHSHLHACSHESLWA